MEDETTADRPLRRATDRAYLEGRRDADVDAALHSHEKRLNAINGSIDRFDNRLARVEGAMATKGAIEEALMKVAEHSGAKRFTRLQSVGIAILSITAIAAVILSIITAVTGHA